MIRAGGKSSGMVFTTEILVAGFVSTDYTNFGPAVIGIFL
jgi:hypothetical protein